MAGWGNSRFGQNVYQQSGASWSDLNAGYSNYSDYGNNNNGSNWEYGGQKWEYQGPSGQMKWSTATDDDESYYSQQPQSQEDIRLHLLQQQKSNFNQQLQSSYNQQQTPLGWQNVANTKASSYQGFVEKGMGRNALAGYNQSMMSGSYSMQGGYGQGQDYGANFGQMPRKRMGGDGVSAQTKKRGRHQKRSQPSQQGGWNEEEYGYKQDQYAYYDPQGLGYGDDQGMGYDKYGSSWNEQDDNYSNSGYDSWSQIPPSKQPSTWENQGEGYYNDETNMYDFDYGGGYEGGYEDPQGYYSNNAQVDRAPQERERKASRTRQEDDPDDKLIYKRHRILGQDRTGREFLLKVIRATMFSLRDASKIMSLELQEKLKSKEKEEEETEQTEMDTEGQTEMDSEKAKNTEKGTDMNEGKKSANGEEKPKEKDELPPQILLGAVRVGAAVKRLLSKEAPQFGAEFVAVFKCKPTKLHLYKVADILKEKISKQLIDKLLINVKQGDEVIEISSITMDCPYSIIIRFTSPLYGKNRQTEEPDPEDVLDETKCKEALSLIRRVRWSLKKVRSDLERPLVRIFNDLTTRVPGWKSLTPYAAEVLVNTVMEKLSKDVRPSEIGIARIFRQSLEVLAEGLLLQGGPGLKDPCESEPTDVFGYLTEQNAEDLTRAAQSALRMIACNRLHELLDTEVVK